VLVGTTLIVDSNTPSAGIDPCRTIWNFYPVTLNGLYTIGGISIVRTTQQALKGFILAPNGWSLFLRQTFKLWIILTTTLYFSCHLGWIHWKLRWIIGII